jgi:threonine dehydratase
VRTSRTADALTGAQLFFKCENFQRMGAFKFRGAYNALAQFSAEKRRAGVIAFSSGNHAQAIALSARLLGMPSVIVMPSDSPAAKLAATRAYQQGQVGSEVLVFDRYTEDREVIGQAHRFRTGHDADPALRPPACDGRAGHGGGGVDR